MSYDVYFWWRAAGHPDDVADGLANEDLTAVTRHEDVRTFRRALTDRYPHLQDSLEPSQEDRHDAYLILTLPLTQAAIADEAIALARAAGLQAYDPQRGQANPASATQPDPPDRPGSAAAAEQWSRQEVAAAAELGPRRLKRAWDFLDLPPTVPFGEALAAVAFALALSDGANIAPDRAALIANSIASAAPRRGVTVAGFASIDFVAVDLGGLARALSQALPAGPREG